MSIKQSHSAESYSEATMYSLFVLILCWITVHLVSGRRIRLVRFSFYLSASILMTFSTLVVRYNLARGVTIIRRHKVPRLPSSGNLIFHGPQMTSYKASFESFQEALENRASPSKDIILALIDKAVLPMALNFWEISLKPHQIDNYLFISSNRDACQKLIEDYSIPCFLYMQDKASTNKSIYMSDDFKRKMNIRTLMILEALQLGYNVLHTDVDEVWFQNPFSDIQCSDKCDIAALWDCGPMNAGFVYVKPTLMGIAVYKYMQYTARTTELDDQAAFNKALGALTPSGLTVVRLPEDKYQCGSRYYEIEQRTFAGDNPCKTCVVAHNNWIVSLEAKMYRFKELHQWMNDEDRYYSSPSRKYIIYNNHYITNEGNPSRHDIDALKVAITLGNVLNRTVILPKFHCGNEGKPKLCSILDFLKVRDLDRFFAMKYRESTFLTHPKVPREVSKSLSKLFVIESKLTYDKANFVKDCTNCTRLKPKAITKGATPDEILNWFKGVRKSVLRFHSLYGAVSLDDCHNTFQSKLAAAFRPGKYRQF